MVKRKIPKKTKTHSKKAKKPKAAAAAAADLLSEEVMIITKDYKILAANKALLRKLGMRRNQVIGKPCYLITHGRKTPCRPPNDRCPLQEIIKTGKPHVEAHTHFDKKGNKFLVNVIAGKIKGTNAFLHIAEPVEKVEKKEKLMKSALKKGKKVITVLENVSAVMIKEITEKIRDVEREKAAAAAAAAAQKAKLEESEKYITEMKKAQEEVLKSEKKFKDIVATVPDWVWEVNERGQYTFVGQQIKKILGYKPEEVLGKTPFDLMPKEEAKKIGKIFMGIAKKKKPFFGLENWNIHKSGRKVLLETSGVPILDEKGKLLGYRGIDRDMTERKKAQEAEAKAAAAAAAAAQKAKLEESEKYITEMKKAQEQIASAYQYSENIVANMPSAIIVFDKKLKCSSANFTYYQTFHKKSKHIIGKDVTQTLPSGMVIRKKLAEKIKQVMKTGKTIELPKCLYHNKHKKFFNIKIVKVIRGKAASSSSSSSSSFVMVILDDVTEKTIVEEALEKAKKELEDKVADLQTFSDVAVGRELKMVELKKQVKRLQEQLKGK